jgi:hypothetical protein
MARTLSRRLSQEDIFTASGKLKKEEGRRGGGWGKVLLALAIMVGLVGLFASGSSFGTLNSTVKKLVQGSADVGAREIEAITISAQQDDDEGAGVTDSIAQAQRKANEDNVDENGDNGHNGGDNNDDEEGSKAKIGKKKKTKRPTKTTKIRKRKQKTHDVTKKDHFAWTEPEWLEQFKLA